MAPVGLVSNLGWFASPEVGIISLVAFLILSIALLTLCAQCQRSENAYEVKGSKTNGAAANGGTSDGVTPSHGWRDHKNMPPHTLERKKAYTQ